MRIDGRKNDELRPIKITSQYQDGPHGSVLIQWGNTWVICAASVEESVPPFRLKSGGGWITGEYNMLPSSTSPRKSRRQGGREKEIQRLIGRGLRAAVDMALLGPRTITLDCDVVQADGGTRVASLTGAYMAMALAISRLQKDGLLDRSPIIHPVAAASIGIVGGVPLLDLPYEEDSRAEVDMNVVMTGAGDLVEIQGTAEGAPFSRTQLNELCDLAWSGIERLVALQGRVLSAHEEGRWEVTL